MAWAALSSPWNQLLPVGSEGPTLISHVPSWRKGASPLRSPRTGLEPLGSSALIIQPWILRPPANANKFKELQISLGILRPLQGGQPHFFAPA
jgi:hypothetical protein